MHEHEQDAASATLEEVVQQVCTSNEPMTIKSKNGRAVKVIPVPEPIEYLNGRPVYRAEDLQYLYLDCPWFFE